MRCFITLPEETFQQYISDVQREESKDDIFTDDRQKMA